MDSNEFVAALGKLVREYVDDKFNDIPALVFTEIYKKITEDCLASTAPAEERMKEAERLIRNLNEIAAISGYRMVAKEGDDGKTSYKDISYERANTTQDA